MSTILILTDQQRHDAVGYVSSFCKTPVLDSLAEDSTVFTNCYTQSPQCHPARVSLVTGKYPSKHQSWNNSSCIGETEFTISNAFSKAGHECAYFGKVHLAGDKNDDRAIMGRLGYNYWYTWADFTQMCRVLGEESILTPHQKFAEIMKSEDWVGTLDRRDIHHDDVITQKAIDYINNIDGDYFIVVSYYGPHPPYASPPPFNTMYDSAKMAKPWDVGIRSVERWQRIKSQYYGCVSWIDDNIGKLLKAAPDATIAFTSDHGDILGDHGYFSKGSFGYDGVVRVPLLIRSSKLVPRYYTHFTQHIDIMPTLLSLNDIEIPEEVQGRPLLSSVNNNVEHRDYALSMVGTDPHIKILRWANFKYWIGPNVEILYDISRDPSEREPIYDAGKIAEARKRLILALIDANT